MAANRRKRKNDEPIKRKRQPRPGLSGKQVLILAGVALVNIALIVIVVVILSRSSLSNQVQSAVPTLAVVNPTGVAPSTIPSLTLAPASGRPTLPPTWTLTPTTEATLVTPISPTLFIPSTPSAPDAGDGSQGISDRPFVLDAPDTGKKIVIDVDRLPLRVTPHSDAQIIEYAVRGAVRTILADSENLEAGRQNMVTWWYIGDGFGWIPSQIDGQPTTRDYAPDTLATMITETDQRLSENRSTFMLHLEKGWMLYGEKDYGSAISEITIAVEMSKTAGKDDPLLYEYRGKVYLDMNDYVNALRNFDQAVDLGENEAALYDRRALAYEGLGRYGEAQSDLSKAVQLDPDYGLLYSNLGSLVGKQGSADPSQLSYYSRAIEADPFFPYAYSNRATYNRLRGDYSDYVINDYTKALSYLPDDLDILNNRGVTYASRGDYSLANLDYSYVIEEDPTFVNAYINRGIDYSKTGNDSKAIDDLLLALNFDSTSRYAALAYYNIGTILQRELQYEGAIYAYNRALEIDPSRQDAQLNRGQIYEMLGGLDEAKIMAYPSIEMLITPMP